MCQKCEKPLKTAVFGSKTRKTAVFWPQNPKPGQVLCEKVRKTTKNSCFSCKNTCFRVFSHNTCPGLGFEGVFEAVLTVFGSKPRCTKVVHVSKPCFWPFFGTVGNIWAFIGVLKGFIQGPFNSGTKTVSQKWPKPDLHVWTRAVQNLYSTVSCCIDPIQALYRPYTGPI